MAGKSQASELSYGHWDGLSFFDHSSKAHQEPLAYFPEPLSWMAFANIIIKQGDELQTYFHWS